MILTHFAKNYPSSLLIPRSSLSSSQVLKLAFHCPSAQLHFQLSLSLKSSWNFLSHPLQLSWSACSDLPTTWTTKWNPHTWWSSPSFALLCSWFQWFLKLKLLKNWLNSWMTRNWRKKSWSDSSITSWSLATRKFTLFHSPCHSPFREYYFTFVH